MRVASYNVENLFRRPIAFNPAKREEAGPVLAAYSELQALFDKTAYTDDDKARMVDLLGVLGLQRNDESEWAFLRHPRGSALKRPRSGGVTIAADGREDWIGWLELKREVVNEVAIRNTAEVIRQVDADMIAVVEAEDRPGLQRFNLDVLRLDSDEDWAESWRQGYTHTMLIDGNDDRGIDVGLMTRDEYPIIGMRSHVDDGPWGSPIFSRDCAEYEIAIPGGESLLLLINHFKSKGYGGKQESDERRKAQAARVAEIYRERCEEGWRRIVVAGDFNDTPDSDPLGPLLEETDLRDAGEHEAFDFGERPGTYGGTQKDQIDFLLLSPGLFETVRGGGINRRGVWHPPGSRTPWELLSELTVEEESASDHAAVWVDLDD